MKNKSKSFSNINLYSFITVVVILCAVLVVCGALSYFVPQGSFERNEAGGDNRGQFLKRGNQGYSDLARNYSTYKSLLLVFALTILILFFGVATNY